MPAGGRATFVSWIAPLAIAAAVAFGAFWAVTRPVAKRNTSTRAEISSSPSTAAILPAFPGKGWEAAKLTDHFLGARDEGIVHRDGQVPVRRYRYRFVDVTTWEHPQANAFIRSSVPREEIVLVGLDPY